MKPGNSFYCYILVISSLFNFSLNENNLTREELEHHKNIVEHFYLQRKNWVTSNMGSILFKNVDPHSLGRNYILEKYVILVQTNDRAEAARFKIPNDILEGCSVDNCIYSDDKSLLDVADAVVINVFQGFKFIPKVKERNPNQLWILFSEESPVYIFGGSGAKVGRVRPSMATISHLFNWTMTFRSDSDIPVPFGRTIPLGEPKNVNMSNPIKALSQLVPYWKQKQFKALALIIMSRCIRGRIGYVNKLREFIQIDVGGNCFRGEKVRCLHVVRGGSQPDCKYTSEYIFYLAFENSNCRQYLSEKCFHHAYSKGAIPVIIGPPLQDCVEILPPNSFLHVDNYNTPEDLTKHMTEISLNMELLLSFHVWRKHFAVVNEHGYFGNKSPFLCRVCEALNYNDGEQKIYTTDDLKLFMDKTTLCNRSFYASNSNSYLHQQQRRKSKKRQKN